MKKSAKVLAVLSAASLSLAAFGFAACDKSGGEEEKTAMTEQNVQTVNSAFTAMNGYSGGYTIRETLDFSYGYDNAAYADYGGTYSGDATVTYDQATGNMAFISVMDGTGMYDGMMDMNLEYYTLKNEDSYRQYAKMAWEYMDLSSAEYTDYAAAPEDCYYTDFNSCMDELYSLDLAEGASINTAEGYALFFEGMLSDNISAIADMYGFTFTYTAGDCTTFTKNDATVYRFKASGTGQTSSGGTTIKDDLEYVVDIYLDETDAQSAKIAKMNLNLTQKLAITYQGVTLTATGTSQTTDIFTYAYDSTVMPSDFSAYTPAE